MKSIEFLQKILKMIKIFSLKLPLIFFVVEVVADQTFFMHYYINWFQLLPKKTNYTLVNCYFSLLASKVAGCNPHTWNNAVVKEVTEKFNQSLWFDAEELKMAYTIRDPVMNS